MSIEPCNADCFAGGTLVRTPWGGMPIESLMVGQQVVTMYGLARIVAAHRATTQQLLRVHFTDATSIDVTPWHRFFEPRGGQVYAWQLPGRAVIGGGSLVRAIRVEDIAPGATHRVFNLSLDRGGSFFANDKAVEASAPVQACVAHSLTSLRSL